MGKYRTIILYKGKTHHPKSEVSMLSVKNIKKHYVIFFETGLILSLLILLTAFNINTGVQDNYYVSPKDVDVVHALESPVTTQKDQPAYLEPTVVAKKPTDVLIEDPIENLDNMAPEKSTFGKLAAPEPKQDKDDIFIAVERQPKMIGGQKSLYENISYPKRAKNAGIEGRVFIKFIVNKDGSVSDAKVIRGIGGGCDEEALEAVKKLTFVPGRQREKAVRVRISLLVTFELDH